MARSRYFAFSSLGSTLRAGVDESGPTWMPAWKTLIFWSETPTGIVAHGLLGNEGRYLVSETFRSAAFRWLVVASPRGFLKNELG